MSPCYRSRIPDPDAVELSVVILANNLSQTAGCLRSLATPAEFGDTEIILVSDVRDAAEGAGVPGAKSVIVPSDAGEPQRRAAGLRAARGIRIAVVCEDYRAEEGWRSTVVRSAAGSDAVVGEIHSPSTGLSAQAIYLWEYLHVAAPAGAGSLDRRSAAWIPAGAVVYPADLLDMEQFAAAESEMDYHTRLFDEGLKFVRDPDLVFRYEPPPLREFLRQRRSRSQRRARTRGGSSLFAASRLALPLVLLVRHLSRLLLRPRYWGIGVATLPYAVLFALAETYGEMEGGSWRTR